jgi:hypothetical protein
MRPRVTLNGPGSAAGFASFRQKHLTKLLYWERRIAEYLLEGRRLVVWGAGSKGVTFLNMLSIDCRTIPFVVDVNPRKAGLYVPGTGQRVIAPPELTTYQPDVVLVMNPAYEAEIRGTLQHLEVAADVVLV